MLKKFRQHKLMKECEGISIDNTKTVCYYVSKEQIHKKFCADKMKGGEYMNMTQKELDARELLEQLSKLPDDARQKVGYIIQGAVLVAENHKTKEPAGPAA